MESSEICLLWGNLQIQKWWSCMSKSEWSGWMQAIFSVAAIFAAIGIASAQYYAEKRRRIDAETVAAIVFGWSVLHLIQPFIKSIFSVSEALKKSENDEARLAVLKRLHEALKYAKLPSESQLTGILSIPDGAAKQVAIGVGQIVQLLMFLNFFFDERAKYPGPIIDICNYVENEAAIAKVHLDKAVCLIDGFQKIHSKK